MCLVDELGRSRDLFAGLGRAGEIIQYAIEDRLKFCELGSVGPDFPFLDFEHPNSKAWANVMHYWRTSDILRAGVSFIASKNLEVPDDGTLSAIAWLFGYSAHVATDLTIHPVLVASGYPYATNTFGHRYCELQQDAYMFRKLKHVDAPDARYIENCGIGFCNDPSDPDKLHPAVGELWLQCLSCISPSQVHIENGSPGPTSDPTPDVWFHHYTKRLGEIVEQGAGFILFFRDFLETEGLCLPKSGEVEMKYITELKTATGEDTNYDAVFESALNNVRSTWEELARAIAAKDQTLFVLKNANLDTGEADDNRQQVFVS